MMMSDWSYRILLGYKVAISDHQYIQFSFPFSTELSTHHSETAIYIDAHP